MSRFTRNRIKARQQRAEQYRRSGHFYDMPVKKLERLRPENAPVVEEVVRRYKEEKKPRNPSCG